MKRNWKFRQWVVNVLVCINSLAIIAMTAECESISLLLKIDITAMAIILFNTYLLFTHSNIFEEE